MSDLTISLIQSDLHWEEIEANLAMFEEKIWTIARQTDLIILPEMFNTGFSMNTKKLGEPMNSKTFRWMKQQAEQTGAMVIGSYIIRESSQFFNRLFAVRPDGTFDTYDKKHLFGLGGENQDFTPGSSRLIINWKNWRILPMICYDLRFPVWIRSKRSPRDIYEYDLAVFVANWPKPRVNAWDILLQARAIENLSFVAGVNRIGLDGSGLEYIGHSAIYDFKGIEKGFLGEKEAVESIILNKDEMDDFRNKFRFQDDADSFTVN